MYVLLFFQCSRKLNFDIRPVQSSGFMAQQLIQKPLLPHRSASHRHVRLVSTPFGLLQVAPTAQSSKLAMETEETARKMGQLATERHAAGEMPMINTNNEITLHFQRSRGASNQANSAIAQPATPNRTELLPDCKLQPMSGSTSSLASGPLDSDYLFLPAAAADGPLSKISNFSQNIVILSPSVGAINVDPTTRDPVLGANQAIKNTDVTLQTEIFDRYKESILTSPIEGHENKPS